jgi:hypothetical protein
MSYPATVYKVFIASPSDVKEERKLIREAIHKWNYIHSENRGIILQPVGWETHSAPGMEATAQQIINETLLDKCDILVGVLWSILGTPTEKAVSGTVEEIDRQIASRKPTMIYFLEKELPYGTDTKQIDSLLEYKGKLQKIGLYACIRNHDDIGTIFFDHLCIKMNEFLKAESITETESSPKQDESELLSNLSVEAKKLLFEASKDASGHITRLMVHSGPLIQTNRISFIKEYKAREIALWENALELLEKNGLVKANGAKREVFNVTNLGFKIADALLKAESDKEVDVETI